MTAMPTVARHDVRFALSAAIALVSALGWVGVAQAGGYTDASYLTPRGMVGQPYSHRVEWKPGNGCPPYSYAVVGGDFPPGLNLASGGVLGGVPTKAGRFSFYIRQTDLCGPEGEGNSPFVIVVDPNTPPPPPPPPPPPLAISRAGLPTGEATLAYAATLTASGGDGTRSWSVTGGQLPEGVTLSTDGRLGGTPRAPGTFGFTATVRAGSGSASADFVITVVPGLSAKTASGLPTLEVRRPLTLGLGSVLGVTGGTQPYRYAAVGGFPFGLGLDAGAGTVFGSPRRAGLVSLAIRVFDANGAALDVTLSLEVVPQLRFALEPLSRPRLGRSYRAMLRATGGMEAVWRISRGALPVGLKLETTTGAITGTPRRKGIARFTVSLRDALGAAVSTRITLHVD